MGNGSKLMEAPAEFSQSRFAQLVKQISQHDLLSANVSKVAFISGIQPIVGRKFSGILNSAATKSGASKSEVVASETQIANRIFSLTSLIPNLEKASTCLAEATCIITLKLAGMDTQKWEKASPSERQALFNEMMGDPLAYEKIAVASRELLKEALTLYASLAAKEHPELRPQLEQFNLMVLQLIFQLQQRDAAERQRLARDNAYAIAEDQRKGFFTDRFS